MTDKATKPVGMNHLLTKWVISVCALFFLFEIGRQTGLADNETTDSQLVTRSSQRTDYATCNSQAIEPPFLLDDIATKANETIESAILQPISNFSSSHSLKTMAIAALKGATTDELIKAVSRLSFLSQTELQGKDKPKEYMERLVDVVFFDDDFISQIEDSSSEDRIEQQDSINKGAIYFSLQVDGHNRATLPESTFYSNVGAVYATFELNQNQFDNQVIVRWFDVNRNKVISFNRLTVDQQYRSQYIWFYPNRDWPEGEYYVSVYQNDDKISPIADGRFQIVRF